MKNIKLTEDFHTHTIYSDGHSSIEENVKQAVEQGLTTIGISDHGFNHRSGVKREKITDMRAEVERLKKIYKINILLGIEANLISLRGDLDLSEDDVKLFDYIIFGVHIFFKPKSFSDFFNFWIRNKLLTTKKYRVKLAKSYLLALDKYPIKAVVHPNYATRVDIPTLAQGCSQRGVFLEINGKGVKYSLGDIEEILKTDVKFIIGSDAHNANRVAEISKPIEFIQKFNIPLDRIVNIKEIEE